MVPAADFFLEGADEGRVLHGGRLHDVVVEQHLDVIDAAEDAHSAVLVRHEGEVDRLPLATHLLQSLET